MIEKTKKVKQIMVGEETKGHHQQREWFMLRLITLPLKSPHPIQSGFLAAVEPIS